MSTVWRPPEKILSGSSLIGPVSYSNFSPERKLRSGRWLSSVLYFINLRTTAFYSLTQGPLRVRPRGVFPIALFLSILLSEVTHPSPPLQCYYLLAPLGAERVVPPPPG